MFANLDNQHTYIKINLAWSFPKILFMIYSHERLLSMVMPRYLT